MPYAPGIQAVPFGGQQPMMGQYKAQGISGGISALNQGLSQWYQNDAQNNKMKAQTMGIIAQDPSILNQFTDPIAQKSLTKVRDGSASAKDILIAYGATTAAKEAKTEQLKNQFVQAQIALLQQQQQTQAKAAADAQLAKDNIALADRATTNPYILNNEALRRGQSLAANPMFGVASAAQKFGIDPSVAAQFMERTSSGYGQTSEMKNTDMIIANELAAQKLAPKDVPARRAELLARGGRVDQQRFTPVGVYVNSKDGSAPQDGVMDAHTGQIGTVNGENNFVPFNSGEKRRIGVTDTNNFLNPEAFNKLRDDLVTQEKSIKQLGKYAGGIEDVSRGITKLADRFSAAIKTSLDGEKLTPNELAIGISQSRLQGILGALRTTVLGPGVLTEIDAKRIIDRVGGDITSASANPEVMKAAISDVLGDMMGKYRSDLQVYNSHVAQRYGASGYQPMKEISSWSPTKVETAAEMRARLLKDK
jgi:hypothetical protein